MQPNELFVRGIWKFIPDQDDFSWVLRIAASEGSNKPMGDFGPIIKEMLDKGVAAESIARLARIVGYETAFHLCYHLDDPNASYEGFSECEEVVWGLFRVNPNSNEPLEPMTCIHEIVLGMDPTGTEMRPRNA